MNRFWESIMPEPNSGCWIWVGNLEKDGYAKFFTNKQYNRAHRFSYEQFVGEIPEGLEIDHKCSIRCCVNPTYMEAVTHQENVKRGLTGIVNRSKTKCPQGHPYSGANLYVMPNGGRVCKICRRASYPKTILKTSLRGSKVPE